MLGTPNRNRVTERREATRREILDAAWEVAREQGLSQITLRDVATRVGMQAPSLYSHFASKNAIYDAMFAQAWTDCHETVLAAEERHAAQGGARNARATLRLNARTFFDFAVSDLARHQLMNQRTIPGFEPTADAYAPAVAVLEALKKRLRAIGVKRQQDVDLYVALVGGLVDGQLANDPGGTRWARLVDRAVDMFANDVGLPEDS
jgi:AcrR family transcriptional regulator